MTAHLLRPCPVPHRAAWLLALFLAVPLVARAQGITVGVTPALMSNVTPGSGIDLELDAIGTSAQFNGWTAVVTYDPAVLTFVQKSPVSQQQGCLMLGGCSAACGNTFHLFNATADSLSITDVLLCPDLFITGPGQLYKLHFTTSLTPQTTFVHIRSAVFSAGGIYVLPVVTQDATIGIGIPLGVDGPGGASSGPHLRAEPNPCLEGTTIRLDAAGGIEERLHVCDLLGRTVRHLPGGRFAAGSRTVAWDGRDDRGARLPGGVYFVVREAGGRSESTRVVLLH